MQDTYLMNRDLKNFVFIIFTNIYDVQLKNAFKKRFLTSLIFKQCKLLARFFTIDISIIFSIANKPNKNNKIMVYLCFFLG